MVLDLAWKDGKPSAPAAPRNLTAKLSYELGSGVGGDNTAPRGAGRPAIVWSADDSHLFDVAAKQGSALLVSVDAASGDLAELTQPKQAVLRFTASRDTKTLIALISNPLLIGDFFAIGPGKSQTQLTHVNDALFSQLDLTLPQEMQVAPTVHPDDIHGQTIDTFVQLPPGFDPKRKYPLILNIHGGPHSAYGWIFDHEMLWMAARGYVVVYPNPRGSTSYGENFANIIEDNYPNDDFHDLMDTVDAVVKQGYVDPDRLGVTGGSGGGLLTDWTVTQTNRFKAAVAQRDIVDWANWWSTADIGEFHQFWMPEAPFDHLQLYKDRSPLTFVNNIKTPMMFILGDADSRTPPTAGGEVFFRALKYKKIPTVMVRFPRETHELSRSGEPWHRIERLENIVNWFDKYLMGVCEPQYDVAPVANPTCKAR
jgi:dipeptidyl aminopeptidase/acylaminoacyl peptidase